MNIDRERIAGMVHIDSNTSSNTETTHTETTHTESVEQTEIDITQLANDIISDIESDTNTIQRDIGETNAQIDKLNQMLANFNASTPQQQQDIIGVLNVSGTVQGDYFTKPEEIKEYLESRIKDFDKNQ